MSFGAASAGGRLGTSSRSLAGSKGSIKSTSTKSLVNVGKNNLKKTSSTTSLSTKVNKAVQRRKLTKSHSDPNLYKASRKYTRNGEKGRFVGGQFVSYNQLGKGGSVLGLDMAYDKNNLLTNRRGLVNRFLARIKNEALRKIVVQTAYTFGVSTVLILLGVGLNIAFSPGGGSGDYNENNFYTHHNYFNGTDEFAVASNLLVVEMNKYLAELQDWNELAAHRKSQGQNVSETTLDRQVKLAESIEDLRYMINKRQQRHDLELEGYEPESDEGEPDEESKIEPPAENPANYTQPQSKFFKDHLVKIGKVLVAREKKQEEEE